jgi:hypothetical protein
MIPFDASVSLMELLSGPSTADELDQFTPWPVVRRKKLFAADVRGFTQILLRAR